MSVAGRGGERRPLDAYYTPQNVATALVGLLDWTEPGIVMEPSVGGGAVARAIFRRWPAAFVIGCDIDHDAAGLAEVNARHVGDYLDVPNPEDADATIGNPPYAHAEEHLRRALESSGHVAFLLRLAVLESVKRAEFWRTYGPRLDVVYVLASRPSFTGGSTDSAAYGWFTFTPKAQARGLVRVVEWSGDRLVPVW